MSEDDNRDPAASLGSVNERDGRHAFMVIEAIAQEADRLGIRAVDANGTRGSVVEFFDKVIRYIKGREGDCEKLARRLRLADAAARANPPALTDAEREAIWTVAEAYAANDGDPECERIARIMQGLWQRTK